MAIPVPGEGRRGLVSFRLFGFPVTIHASFLVVVLVLSGFDPLDPDVAGVLAWLGVVVVSVIAHELGHAFVAAPVGGRPRIDLYMMAGLTTWQPSRASRGRRVAVSVAGPFAGVVLGVALLVLYGVLDPADGSLARSALLSAVFVNLGWGLLNLVPMLPLDGGQIVLALMPGRDDLVRLLRASYLSLGVAAVLAVAGYVYLSPITAVFVLFFGAGNLQRIVALRKGEDPVVSTLAQAEVALHDGRPEEVLRLIPGLDAVAPPLRGTAAIIRAAALLRLGRHREAQDTLVDLPAGSVEPVFAATVLLANGQEQLARERLAPALAADPPAWAVRELALLLRTRGDDLVGTIGAVTGSGAAGVLDALYRTGDHAAAAAWGERALATGATEPGVAYNTACSYARAGDPGRALRALGYAAELGWSDFSAVDADPDLAPVRALPAWAEVRARMGGRLGAPPGAR
jgi:Zn-dependent protease